MTNAAHAMFAADQASKALGIELLAATAFALACNSHGPATVAAGAEISFVSAGRLGDHLVATAAERTRYGRNGIYDVTVHRETPAGREIVAEFRGRSRVIDHR